MIVSMNMFTKISYFRCRALRNSIGKYMDHFCCLFSMCVLSLCRIWCWNEWPNDAAVHYCLQRGSAYRCLGVHGGRLDPVFRMAATAAGVSPDVFMKVRAQETHRQRQRNMRGFTRSIHNTLKSSNLNMSEGLCLRYTSVRWLLLFYVYLEQSPSPTYYATVHSYFYCSVAMDSKATL